MQILIAAALQTAGLISAQAAPHEEVRIQPQPRLIVKKPAKPKIFTQTVKLPAKPRPTPAELCTADGGRWYIDLRPISMTASGSDVDELYGTIHIVAANKDGPARGYRSSIRRPGRAVTDLWFSPQNANVGKYGGKDLARITITMDGTAYGAANARDYVRFYFGVRDEDDGRGGSNDERFVVQGSPPSSNSHLLRTPMPSCEETPNYERATRFQIIARSNGNNRVVLVIHARWYRQTGVR